MTLPSQKGNPARRVTLLAEPTFCFSCERFAKFCKEMYEKLAQGSSGRRVTLLPWTTFLHINGASVIYLCRKLLALLTSTIQKGHSQVKDVYNEILGKKIFLASLVLQNYGA